MKHHMKNGMTVEHISAKNTTTDKPNEDALYIDESHGLFIVIDGVSRDRTPNTKDGVYPSPSPTVNIVNAFIDFIKDQYNPEQSLSTLFALANEHVQHLNKTFHGTFKPAFVAVAVRIKDENVEWLSIGDCAGLYFSEHLFKNNIGSDTEHQQINCHQFNTCQTKQIEDNAQLYDTDTIRQHICNNPDHTHSYGVINGDPRAMNFFETGSFSLASGDTLCLLSDGLDMFLQAEHIEALIQTPLPDIVTLAEKHETEQNIRTDDKTIIRISM